MSLYKTIVRYMYQYVHTQYVHNAILLKKKVELLFLSHSHSPLTFILLLYHSIVHTSQFMESTEAKYDEQAREAGVYIVSACAFDCIPNDLGALLLQRTFSGELVYVDSYMIVSDEVRSNQKGLVNLVM